MGPEDLFKAIENLTNVMQGIVAKIGTSGLGQAAHGSGAAAIQMQQAQGGGTGFLGSVASAAASFLPVVGQVAGVLAGITAAATGIVAAGAPSVFATLTESFTLLVANVATALTPAFTDLAFMVQDAANWVKQFGPLISDAAGIVVSTLKVIGAAFTTVAEIAATAIRAVIDAFKYLASWFYSFNSTASKLSKKDADAYNNAKTPAERVKILEEASKNASGAQKKAIVDALQYELKGLGSKKYLSLPPGAQATRSNVEDVRANVQNRGLGMSGIQQQILEQQQKQYELQEKQLAEEEKARIAAEDLLRKITR